MISPKDVSAAAAKREDENLRFRTFLKNHADPDELDQQFLALHQELFANTIAVNVGTAVGGIAQPSRKRKLSISQTISV